MHEDLERVLYTAQQLDQITDQIAAALRRDYQGKEVVFVCLLKGSFVFFADLVRKAGLDAEVDFMAVSNERFGFDGTEILGSLSPVVFDIYDFNFYFDISLYISKDQNFNFICECLMLGFIFSLFNI